MKNSKIEIDKNEVHVWITRPNEINDDKLLDSYLKVMSREELAGQGRYRTPNAKKHVLITRTMARSVLSAYLDAGPEDIGFLIKPGGKPEVVKPESNIQFNLSHSGEVIVCAVSTNDAVGVDVENIERKNRIMAVARRFFSNQEVSVLEALKGDEKRQFFFDCWTLKEAYLKACGDGLRIPLDSFYFLKGKENEISICFLDKNNNKSDKFQFKLFMLDSYYKLALGLCRNKKKKTRVRFFLTTPLKRSIEVDLPLPSVNC